MLNSHNEGKEEEFANKQKCISSRMIPTKMMYFTFFGMLGSYVPYFTVFFTSVGLTESQAGFITGLRSLSSCIAGPLWGIILDHTGRRKLILVILNFGTLALIFPLPWIASHVGASLYTNSIIDQRNLFLNTTNTTLFNTNTSGWKGSHSGLSKSSFNTNQSKRHLNISHQSVFNSTVLPFPYKMDDTSVRQRLFVAMLVTSFISAVFDVPLLAYQDSIAMNVIKNSDEKVSYGPQRIFGSLGFGIVSFVAGLVADNYQDPKLSSYTGIFFVVLVCGVISFPPGMVAISQGKREKASKPEKEKDNSILRTVYRTCVKPANLMFLLTLFVMGLANAFFYGFTYLLMEKEMNASKTEMGLVVVFACASELILFPFASKAIHLVGGNISAISLALLSYFFRFFLISYIENPLIVLPLQLLHSVGFALFWAATVAQTEAISPENIKATMFTISHTIHFACGSVVGNMGGGVLYQKFGGRAFFRYSSFLFLIWFVVVVIYFRGSRWFCAKRTPETKKCDIQLDDVVTSLVDKTDLN